MDKRTFGDCILFLCWLFAGILLFAPTASAQVSELRPNLQPFPASNLALVPDFLGGTKLIFSTMSWNSGAGALELIADLGDPSSGRQRVYQRVYLSDGSHQDFLAGEFQYHPEHGHFHFEDYAVYTLQPVNAPGGSQRTSSKTTFCIIDTTKVNTRLPGAPKRAVYTTCGPAVQGMSVGWGDTYGSNLPGQSIDFTGNPDGDYRLVIEVDPRRLLLETNDVDNISCVLLRISATNLTVQVLGTGCDSSAGEVSVSNIDPSTALAGSVVPVTITGSGFVAGMQVTFENGSGPTPTASNVVVLDANIITATVTVKSGGPARERIWDVRVGSGVLVDGFTVVP